MGGGQNSTSINSIVTRFPYMELACSFRLSETKPEERYVWSDFVHLIYPKYFIHKPFNYGAHDDFIQPKQHVSLTRWKSFLYFYSQFSIIPTTLSTLTVCKSSTVKRKK